MSVLEIVLTALSGALICMVVMAIVIIHVVTNALTKKVVNYEVLNEFAPKNPIVFLGDSLTDLYPVHEFIHDDRIINRGISNETTYDIENRLKDIAALSPSCVILLCGINDFLRLKGVKKPKAVAERVIVVAKKLAENCKDVRVVSLYPINKGKTKLSPFYLRKTSNEKIRATNALLESLCKVSGFKFINLNPLLRDEEGNLKDGFTFEGLHLNLTGYKFLTPYFEKEIESVKKE